MILTPIHPTTIANAGGSGDAPVATAAGLLDFGELLGLQLAQSAKPASDDSSENNNQLAGALGGAPVASRQLPVASGKLPVESCKLPDHRNTPEAKLTKAGNSSVIPLPAAPDGAEKVQRWNLRELAHQVQAAAGSLGLDEAPAGQGALRAAPAAASFLAQASGERIRAAGTQNLLQSGKSMALPAEALKEAIRPVAAGPEAQDAAGRFLASPDPRFKATAALASAAPKLQGKAAVNDFDFSPTASVSGMNVASGGNDLRTLVFSPHSAAGETRGTRTLPMIEQVRQVADFMAERTEGVIRMGQDGVQAHLRLDPPDLGGVRVQLSIGPDRATQTQFIVERSETAALLQQHLRTYQQGLESHGLTVDRVQVTLQPARPASAGPDSGWRQQASPDDPRRQGFMREDREYDARRQNKEVFE